MGWKAPGKEFPETLAAAFSLTSYSLEQLHKCAVQNALAYEQSQGNLLLWQSEAEVAQHQAKLLALKELGLVAQVLTVAEARALEPALQQDYSFQSATYFPSDEIGNCRQYAHLLKGKLMQGGAELHFDTPVSAVSSGSGIQIHTLAGAVHGVDHAVICAGTGTTAMGMPIAPKLPLTTVWSYSLSAPIREPLNAPRSAVQDCQNQVTISRIGGRLRVAGGAELGARKRPNADNTIRRLYRSLNTLFPGAADFSRTAQVWKGASQFTPDGLPLVGPSAVPGIWFNVGHGQNGWAMAAGSARIIADLVVGKQAEIDVSKLRPGRFHK
jgi:D-amino-acid dehydrogenase